MSGKVSDRLEELELKADNLIDSFNFMLTWLGVLSDFVAIISEEVGGEELRDKFHEVLDSYLEGNDYEEFRY